MPVSPPPWPLSPVSGGRTGSLGVVLSSVDGGVTSSLGGVIGSPGTTVSAKALVPPINNVALNKLLKIIFFICFSLLYIDGIFIERCGAR